MIASSQHKSVADYYFDFLKNLNSDSKLELISRLSLSLKEDKKTSEATLQSLFGAYKSDDTADEIIAGIRSSKVFNRTIESF